WSSDVCSSDLGEHPCQDEVQDEAKVDHHLDGEDETEERRRVENVAVSGSDERQSPEQFGIPQRHMAEAMPPFGAPVAGGIAGGVLVAPRGSEPFPLQ